MAQHRHVILVCDVCGIEEPNAVIETHRVTVDGRTRDAEACESCWAGLMGVFAQFAQAGREPEKRKVKKADILQWPDTPWTFTTHCMQRMVERGVTPQQILRVIEFPELRTPADRDGEEVWVRGKTKIVVNPNRMMVVTTAKTSDNLAEAS